MVVNAPDSPIQANVIFVIETTSANSVYINELKTNYIVPTLEYFHGGALEEGIGSGSVYGIVAYQAADCHPDLPVSTYGPFTCPQAVLKTVDELQFIGGHAENRACITEALSAALECLEELGGIGLPFHVILLCCSPPYSTYTGGLVPPGAPNCVEQAARQCAERGAQLSVAAARRVPALLALYEHAGGELHAAQQRNYAKDPRHLVLLRGYSLKERPPSPAPPPAPLPPLVQTEVFVPTRTVVPQQKVPQVQFQRGTVGPVKSNFLAPPRQAPYANSALLTQLSQPSYPPPPTQSSIQRMVQPGPSNAVGVSSSQGVSVGNIGMNMQSTQGVSTVGGVGVVVNSQGVASVGGVSVPLQRTYIWSGVLEWLEKGKASGDQKVIRQIPCQVSANSKEVEPELKTDTWPNKLLMQLMHKQLITNIGGQYLNNSKSVLFHFQQNEALEALTKVMVGGFAGCVHFSPHQCDIRVLILLYTPDKKAYLGFIPNNQATFVDRLRKVIQQQKISKQLLAPGAPQQQNIPGATLGTSMQAGLSMGGAMTNVSSMSNQQPQQHQQNMMMGGGMGGQVNQVGQVGQVGQVAQVGQVGTANKPRGVPLDGLEAARQQNLEKIQHLQQTLEAAHQQEAQFKSQMDIMSHLHAAQQQEQHYKQLEEQRKHQLLQQQLRAAPRIMRPHMPANPGLRHLLQQQPQYRASAPRTSTQPQQFDDVSNYDFL